jgi:hypothetical protein
MTRCPTGKLGYADRETAAFEARRLRLRVYPCSKCQGWHLSSKPRIRPRVSKLSWRECREVWSL